MEERQYSLVWIQVGQGQDGGEMYILKPGWV